MNRPLSIAELALDRADQRTLWYDVRDFIDEVRRLRDPAMLEGEPHVSRVLSRKVQSQTPTLPR